MEADKKAGKPVDKRAETFLQSLATPGKLEKEYDDLGAALLKACQPQKHHFTLVKK
jgi:hypothetical protein